MGIPELRHEMPSKFRVKPTLVYKPLPVSELHKQPIDRTMESILKV
jgi:hypothetical protein